MLKGVQDGMQPKVVYLSPLILMCVVRGGVYRKREEDPCHWDEQRGAAPAKGNGRGRN
jgi:hypothetical protein